MRKSRRVLGSKETLRRKSRKWQWGLKPEEQDLADTASGFRPGHRLRRTQQRTDRDLLQWAFFITFELEWSLHSIDTYRIDALLRCEGSPFLE
jgi:hypothetical protein